jgi:hypothetical protein
MIDDALTQVVVWLNAVANFLGQALGFIGIMPGWLSATIVAIASGSGLLLVFKYTSNQRAIKRARQQIRSGLLSVKLFFDSPWVGFRGQAAALVGALKLLLLAIVPIVVMTVPVFLLLGQLALWYQARPLKVGEETIVTLKLDDSIGSSWPKVTLDANDAIDDTHGPVRVFSKYEICWNIRAKYAGTHMLAFRLDGQTIDKELAIGDGFMRVSQQRPDWDWWQALLHPREPPFPRGFAVRSIDIQYPTRPTWVSGTNSWVYYWIIVSLVAGFLLRGVFRVNL